MACKLCPRQVLSHLNRLGYRNISAEQLKSFMKDLKKLIKYEQRQRENFENVPPAFPYNDFMYQQKDSSNAKETEKIKLVSVEIRPKSSVSRQLINQPLAKEKEPKAKQNKIDPARDHLRLDVTPSSTKTNVEFIDCASSDRSSKRSKSSSPRSKTKSKTATYPLKTKSYIVPKRPSKLCKSDPVALYHMYKKEWSKHKLPGEDNRDELRWAIRQRMLGQPDVMPAVPLMESIARQC